MDPTMILADQTSGNGGPPAGTPPNSPAGDSSAQALTVKELAYLTQLEGPLLNDQERLAKLAKQGRTISSLADGFLQAQEKLAQFEGKTLMPTKDATPEQRREVLKALGLPEKPEYSFDRTGELANVPTLPGMDEWTAQLYHQAGLLPDQAQLIFQANGKKALEIIEAHRKENDKARDLCTAELQRRWGPDKYEQKVADFNQAVQAFFGEKSAKAFLASPLANDPEFIDKLAGLRQHMTDGKVFSGGQGSGGTNPWADATFNLTEQGRIVRENPDLARTLAQAAGKKAFV